MVLSQTSYKFHNAVKNPQLTQVLLLSKEVASISFGVNIFNRMVELEEDCDIFE